MRTAIAPVAFGLMPVTGCDLNVIPNICAAMRHPGVMASAMHKALLSSAATFGGRSVRGASVSGNGRWHGRCDCCHIRRS